MNERVDENKDLKRAALSFIVLMGVVSLFSDMTHEGGKSILGAYLSLTGASAAVVGFVSGFGELVGYSLRCATGRLADRTKRYWLLTIVGYAVDLLAVPALALVPENGWLWAAALIVVERAGKAVKKPAKDTLLSFAAAQNGVGRSFALQEFLDQLGAFLGPVALFAVMYFKGSGDSLTDYRRCFALLAVPALVTMGLLLAARRLFPQPENFEPDTKKAAVGNFASGKKFTLYIAGISLFALGFMDFAMISMHVSRRGLMSPGALPLLYAAAMGAGMGAQESILKAAVATLVPKERRSSGYGSFQTAFGVCLFAGGWLMGCLYDRSPAGMAIFSMSAELGAAALFWRTARPERGGEGKTAA